MPSQTAQLFVSKPLMLSPWDRIEQWLVLVYRESNCRQQRLCIFMYKVCVRVSVSVGSCESTHAYIHAHKLNARRAPSRSSYLRTRRPPTSATNSLAGWVTGVWRKGQCTCPYASCRVRKKPKLRSKRPSSNSSVRLRTSRIGSCSGSYRAGALKRPSSELLSLYTNESSPRLSAPSPRP